MLGFLDIFDALGLTKIEQLGGGGDYTSGGGLLGAQSFAANTTRATWVAVFTFFVIWWFAILLFPIARRFLDSAEAEAVEGVKPKRTLGSKMRDVSSAALDGSLILLGTTVINQAGHGVTAGNLVLTWLVFALLVVLLFAQLVPEVKVRSLAVDLPLWVAIVTLTIINFALAYRGGATSG